MTFGEILQVLQTLSVIAALIVAVGTIRGRGDDKTAAMTEMRVDIKYIKEKVNGFDGLKIDTSKALQSASSAHKRLDDHLRYDHQKDVPKRDE